MMTNVSQSWMDTPEDTGVHPKGLALLLNQPLRFDSLDSFDRGVVYSACTVVVRTNTSYLPVKLKLADE